MSNTYEPYKPESVWDSGSPLAHVKFLQWQRANNMLDESGLEYLKKLEAQSGQPQTEMIDPLAGSHL